jgi:hypothetical protein
MSGADDRFWHEAAVRRVQNYVRFLGYSGREMLVVRLSHFDPNADIEQRLMLQERTRVLPYQSTRLSWYDAVS